MMDLSRRFWGIVLLSAGLLTPPALAQSARAVGTRPDVAESEAGMVVSDTTAASDVGREVLAEGGNAVDASVATAFALAVTWPEAGNIGGGGFMMVSQPQHEVVCVDYRETAPAAADRTSFVDWTQTRHPRMVGVPGTVRGLFSAHQRWGRLPWRRLVTPAADLARSGFHVDEHLADSLNTALQQEPVQTEPRFAEFRRVYGHPDDRQWRAGDRLVLPELAETLMSIADGGPKAFYQGAIAESIVDLMQQYEGLITLEDLKGYEAKVRPAVIGSFYGHTVCGPPLPSSGGATILWILRIVETLGIEPQAGDAWTADQVHVIVEAMRRAYRERAAHLGDTDFVDVPEEIWTAEFARQLAQQIDPQQATPSESIAGEISLSAGPNESPETTHFSVVDSDGLAVANTFTLERRFGSRMVVPGHGFLLNNEMGDFNWQPGVTTRSGQIGTEPNLIAPGKRMLSSQSPTIVRRDGQVVLVTGSPGGRTIINTVSEILIQTLALRRSLAEAIDAPRFHHQWFPDEIRLEDLDALDPLVDDLRARGHKVVQPEGYLQGSAHSIAVDPETGVITGVADWRRGGKAAAVQPE